MEPQKKCIAETEAIIKKMDEEHAKLSKSASVVMQADYVEQRTKLVGIVEQAREWSKQNDHPLSMNRKKFESITMELTMALSLLETIGRVVSQW